jgi:hypothetical protein
MNIIILLKVSLHLENWKKFSLLMNAFNIDNLTKKIAEYYKNRATDRILIKR